MSTKRERELVEWLSAEWDNFIGFEDDDGEWHEGSDDFQGVVAALVEIRRVFGVAGKGSE